MKNTSVVRRYLLFSLVLMLVSNRFIYNGARLFNRALPHLNMSLPVDGLIPFLPWTIVIYAGVNAWWLYTCRYVTLQGKQEADRYFSANLLSKTVSFLFFVFVPTAIVRPEVTGDTFWGLLVGILYRLDPPDNLFPSIHCVLSWLCWVVVRGRRDVPLWHRAAAFALAAAVCLSTLTLRQHVLADVVGGILVSELCYALTGSGRLSRIYGGWMDKLLRITETGKEVH